MCIVADIVHYEVPKGAVSSFETHYEVSILRTHIPAFYTQNSPPLSRQHCLPKIKDHVYFEAFYPLVVCCYFELNSDF